VFEPIHGSAPGIAGRDAANPVGAILSAAMLLRYGLDLPVEADAVESAVAALMTSGPLTRDLGGSSGTREVTVAVIERLASAA